MKETYEVFVQTKIPSLKVQFIAYTYNKRIWVGATLFDERNFNTQIGFQNTLAKAPEHFYMVLGDMQERHPDYIVVYIEAAK